MKQCNIIKGEKKKVLITRELDSKGVFCRTLIQNGYEVSGIPLIDIVPVSFSLPLYYKWVFFTSPNAVNQFFFINKSA